MKLERGEARAMESLPWHDTWKAVDETSDPQWFVHFLDVTRAKKRRKATTNPQQYFAYLDIQPGHNVLELGCGTWRFFSSR